MEKTTNDNPDQKPKRRYRQRDLSAPLDVLTPAQERVLLVLARYRYMTVRQLVECGVSKSPSTMRNRILYRMARRAKNNLIQFNDYSGEPISRGRLSYMYALTVHGAERAAELLKVTQKEIRYPIGGIKLVNDHKHREAYIDFCIALDKWADVRPDRHILALSHYFDKTGSNRTGVPLHSVNRIALSEDRGIVEPDGICFVKIAEKHRALAIEIHNTTNPKRIVEQLLRHTIAIADGTISKNFGHGRANYVLSVALSPNETAAIRERMNRAHGFMEYKKLFLFNDMQTIWKNGFGTGWVYADGKDASGVFE